MADHGNFSRYARTDTVRADLKRKSIRGAAFFAASSAIDVALRFVSIAVLARLLSPEDFGLVAMVAALMAMTEGVRDLGLSSATVQRPELTHAQASNLFWLNVALGVVFGATLSLTSPLIATFYGDSRVVEVAIALSMVFVWGGLTVQHEALMSRQLRQGEIASIRLVASVLSTVVAVLMAVGEWGYWALVWREVARSALIAGGVWLYCQWLPTMPKRNVGTRSIVRFGAELSFTYLFLGLVANVDKLLIGRVFGATPLGLYRQAEQLVLAPIEQLNGPIMSVGQPALSALQADPPRFRRYYERIVFLVALATVPLGLYIALYAEEVTLALLGHEWQDAAVFVCIFGVAGMIRPTLNTSGFVLVTCGHSTRLLLLSVASGVVLTILLLAGLQWGPRGVALAHVSATFIMVAPKLYFSFLRTPVTIGGFLAAVRAPVIASFVMAAGLLALRICEPTEITWLSLLLGATVGCATYLLGLWMQPDARFQLSSMLRDFREALRRRQIAAGSGMT